MEAKYINKEIRNFYKDVKSIRKEYQHLPPYIKSKDGKLIGSEEMILERWKEHFEESLKEGTEKQAAEELTMVEEENPMTEPSVEEIEAIIQHLKNYKSPGENSIAAENLKYGGVYLQKRITTLIKEIWKTESMPGNWRKAIILPIHKKQ
ncbi:hypothetical protein QE152_g22635 [Popillia japonica]|uniref:Uncharacterized protein n=1 Tax=Popillia japonica TaxID=7064 RepID=A0AAW1KK90_POPJA